MRSIVECVPNFSEGRRREVIDRIVRAIGESGPVRLLNVESDADYHRTVVTFVGGPDEVAAAAFVGIREASEAIDMTVHRGEHPRLGAMDVVPFVPVSGVGIDECRDLARGLGERVGRELGLPVYLYGEAAAMPDRRDLGRVRRGQYEGLRERIVTEEGRPDFGPAEFLPRFGAVIIGARPFLIAYNVNLETTDVEVARRVAREVRESGYVADGSRVPGSLRCVKAVGVAMEEHGITQVSMNLTDFNVTPIHAAFEEVARRAGELGVSTRGSEIVGLVPKESLIMAGRHFLAATDAGGDVPEKQILESAVRGLGLESLAPFSLDKKVLEFLI